MYLFGYKSKLKIGVVCHFFKNTLSEISKKYIHFAHDIEFVKVRAIQRGFFGTTFVIVGF